MCWQATGANSQPSLQRRQGLLSNRNASPLRTFTQDMRLASRQVYPPFGIRTGLNVQADQFAHAQPAAVKQFHHRRIAGLQPGVGIGGSVLRELHCIVHVQGFRQRFGRFWRSQTRQRVGLDQTLFTQPIEKTSPARKNERNTARASATGMHLRHPTPKM